MFDLDGLLEMQSELLSYIPHGHKIPEPAEATTIAAIGFIEEICEYVETCGLLSFDLKQTATVVGSHYSSSPPVERHKDEEIADTLFFFLEMMLFQGFSPSEVMKEVEKIRGVSTMEDLLESFQYTPSSNSGVDLLCNIACALINRTLVFLGTIGFKSWRPNPLPREAQIKEFAILTIVYAELLKASGVSLDRLKGLYVIKWGINRERWTSAKQGDYSWDKRGTKL